MREGSDDAGGTDVHRLRRKFTGGDALAQHVPEDLAELLPDVPKDRRNLIAHSIVGQCVFHRLAQPIVALLVGEEEYRTYDVDRLADHIVAFSLAALGLGPPIGTVKGDRR